MNRIIQQLKDQLEGAKDEFIEDCLIVKNTIGDRPIPNTEATLDYIEELTIAISILENEMMYKSRVQTTEPYTYDNVLSAL